MEQRNALGQFVIQESSKEEYEKWNVNLPEKEKVTYTMLDKKYTKNFRKAVHTGGPIKLCDMCSNMTDEKPWKSYVQLVENPGDGWENKKIIFEDHNNNYGLVSIQGKFPTNIREHIPNAKRIYIQENANFTANKKQYILFEFFN